MAKGQGNKPRYKVKQVEEALRRAGGINSAAAKLLGCSPATMTNYLRRHATLRRAKAEIKESFVDLAESKLMQLVRQGHPTAIIFTLKTLGKDRGYSQRHEVAVVEAPKVSKHDVAFDMTVEELEASVLRRMEAARKEATADPPVH